jgi:hypothetical protein
VSARKEDTHTNTVHVFAPDYFSRFRCKCGDCRAVCCHGWRITLSRAEYFRLLGIECSPELRRRIDTAFYISENPTEEEYAYISPSADGNCHMLDADGWCMLHRECGEGVQPAVCRLYPRAIRPGNPAEAVCSGSCEKTIEMLMEEPYPLPFTVTELQTKSVPPAGADPEQFQLRRRCVEVWQSPGDTRTRFRALADLLGVSGDGFSVNSTEEFLAYARDLLEFFARGDITLCDITEEALERFSMTDGVTQESVAAFTRAEAQLKAALPDLENYYGNIMSNHMFYASFPYATEEGSFSDAYRALAAVYVILRFLCACAASRDRVRDAFADIAATAMRYMEHTDFYSISRTVHAALGRR